MNHKVFISLAFAFLLSCSSAKLRDISPKDYEFNNEYVQSKWEEYLNLSDCQKVDFVDSIYSISLYNSYNKYLDSNFVKTNDLDTNLYYYHNNKLENFYYWIFREIEFITGDGLSIPVTHFGYSGLTNIQVTPVYLARDGYEKFKNDVNRWKAILNCK